MWFCLEKCKQRATLENFFPTSFLSLFTLSPKFMRQLRDNTNQQCCRRCFHMDHFRSAKIWEIEACPLQFFLQHCQTNPSPNTVRRCQLRVLSQSGLVQYVLFTVLWTACYRSKIWKVSTEWLYQYLNSYSSQYTVNWTLHVRERKIELLRSYLTPVMKTCWQISVKKRAFVFAMQQSLGSPAKLHRADLWGTCK